MKLTKSLLTSIALSALVACGGGGGGSSPATTNAAGLFQMSGQVQKGPLLQGSTVWVAELDSSLNANGKAYLAETTDDLGNFTLSQNVGTQLVDIWASGYYMDELTGNLSTAPLTLKAFADLSVDATPTVNILTTIQKPRLKALVKAGKSYAEAYTQSQNEVIAAFGIDSTKISSLSTLYAMQINGVGDQDAVLLAASSVLAKMATTAAAANSSSQAAELSDLLLRIGKDIEASGALTTASIISARNTAATNLDLASVTTNVETYYARKGVTVVAPKFEEWIDKDGSGVLPRRKITATSDTFTNDTNKNYDTVVNSNSIHIAGVGSSKVFVSLSGDGSPVLLKNGSPTSTLFSYGEEGDTFAIRSTTPTWGTSNNFKLYTGSQELRYSVATKSLIATFYQGNNSSSGCQTQGGASADYKYFATPFRTSSNDFSTNATVTSKFIGLSLLQSGPTSGPLVPLRIEIQSDSGGSPSGTVLANAVIGSYALEGTNSGTASASVLDRSNTSYVVGRMPVQGYLGSSGLTLNTGTTYWAIAVYSAATRPDVDRCGASEPTAYGRTKISSDGTTWVNSTVGYLPRVALFE